MTDIIASIPYPLGMLITAFLVLVAIKIINYLWPTARHPSRKEAAILATFLSIYGPTGILCMAILILLVLLIKLATLIFPNNWWNKPL